MNTKRRLLIFLIILLSLPVVVLIVFKTIQHEKIQAWMDDSLRLDHTELIEACREMIKNRHSYRKDNAHWPEYYKNVVIIDKRVTPYSTKIPLAVRRLNPRSIMIRDEYVLLDFRDDIRFTRLCILGFKEGVREFGTFKYADGLWFWNGYRNKDVNPDSAGTDGHGSS